jgi:hypothetical protein
MAAVTLLTVEPTDRALVGWCPFGTGYSWQDHINAPGFRIMDIVAEYVWA